MIVGAQLKTSEKQPYHPSDMTDKIAPLDDIEVVNPLGSSTGKHQLSMFYFTINNLEQIGKLSHVYIHIRYSRSKN